ncbi:MAG: hypothetical protein PHS04_16075 [Tissierellia bacterium]|nr:hypothetical protein [Tissierellia bacterium]
MTESFTKDEMEKVLKYVQKKERLISALNSAVRTAEAPIYAEVLNELIVLIIEDKLLPDSLDTHAFAGLYPRAQQKKEMKDEDKDVQ